MRRSIDRLLDTHPPLDCTVTAAMRQRLLTQYGDFTLAYSIAHQSGLEWFGDARGLFAFGRKMRCTLVLGDPLARPQPAERRRLVDEFLQHYPGAVFVQCSPSLAQELSQRGYRATAMGVDHILNLQQYSFAGKRQERFRYAANWLTRRGFQLEELTYEQLGRPRARRLSVAWRRTRTVRKREVRFINRPLVYRDEPDVRKFYLLDPDGQLVAFVGLDPLYAQGSICGYCTAFKRRMPDAPQVAELGMMKLVIDRLQAEGVAELRLGLSPLATAESPPNDGERDEELPSHPLLGGLFRWAYQAKWINGRYYNVQGHSQYKRRFGGRELPQYFCTPPGTLTAAGPLISLLRLCKLI